jgi:phage pi2 protein 07
LGRKAEKRGELILEAVETPQKIWWTMKDLEQVTGYSDDWLRENILLRPAYKKILDLENGGFVYYPERRGEKWMFIASKMQEFLERYFIQIFGR